MNQQYGTNEVQLSTPTFLLRLMKHFNVSRDDFVSSMLIPGEALLDLGSGDGDFCAQNKHKFLKVVGVDISSERVDRAQQNYAKTNCTFLQHDLNEVLPFPDHTFTAIASMVTLDQVHDLTTCLKEVRRVLTPGGKFIFEVNNLGYFVRRIQLLFGRYPKTSAFVRTAWPTIGWDASICHYFTKKELSEYLTQLGFTVEKITGSGLFYQLRNWWPSLLCGDLIIVCTVHKAPEQTT